MTTPETPTIASVLHDPMVVFGLALIVLSVILLFTFAYKLSFILFIGVGFTAGRLSSLMDRS